MNKRDEELCALLSLEVKDSLLRQRPYITACYAEEIRADKKLSLQELSSKYNIDQQLIQAILDNKFCRLQK